MARYQRQGSVFATTTAPSARCDESGCSISFTILNVMSGNPRMHEGEVKENRHRGSVMLPKASSRETVPSSNICPNYSGVACASRR